jgi:hypothetical protein
MKWWIIWSVILVVTLFFMYSGYRAIGLEGMIWGAILGILLVGGIFVINYTFKQ